MKRVAIIFLMGILAIQACKEGCTNANALNYDSKAQSDDGSCLYCDTTWNELMLNSNMPLYDDNISSPYYMQQMLYLQLKAYKLNATGNSCNTFLQGQCAPRMEHVVQVSNFRSVKVVLTGSMNLIYSSIAGNEAYEYRFDSLVLMPNSTFVSERVLPVCVPDGFNVSHTTNYTISY